ncbi:MAG TPA: UbiA family prenyltransferase [Jiangellaceae bacterium]
MTSLGTALGAVLGVAGTQLATLTIAVFSGQLSVGWLNDFVDRHRDRAAGRTDKPLAMGTISPATVQWAITVAAAVCVPASLALGVVPGTAHLIAVAAAWAYNLGGKQTVLSWLPYAVGFGLLPAIAWLVSPQPGAPPWWMIAGGALLGIGAHGANVLPDLETDRVTGVAGFPHRLPRTVLRVGTAAVLFSALTLLTLGPARASWLVDAVVLAAGAALAVVAAGVGGTRLPARVPLLAAAAIAALAIASLLVAGAGQLR